MNKNEIKKASVRASRTTDGFTISARQRKAVARPGRKEIAAAVTDQPPVAPAAAADQPEIAAVPDVKYYPLPAYEAPDRPAKPYKRRVSRKVLVLRASSVLLAIFLATGGFLTWRGYNNFHKVFHGTTTVAALTGKKVAPYQLSGEGDGRVNILLLGIGGPGHDGPDLTDTMMVLSVDPVNNSAVMLSVPRDLWVKMPVNYFGSSQKINAAYESGKYTYLGHMDDSSSNAAAVQAGFAADDQVLKNVLDININYHVLVDFQAFRQAIDTVGGVTINVPTPLVDPTMAWENGGNPILAAAGIQQMDGVKALQYARSRETTSDFARAERQRQIMVALKDKVLTAGTLSNPAKIDGLMNAFGDNIYSDMSSQGALRLMTMLRQVGDSKITSVSLSDDNHKLVTTDHIGATSIVRPTAGLDNYTAIQGYVRASLPDGYLVKEQAPVAVMGLSTADANNISATLSDYGYRVTSATVSTLTNPAPIVVDLSRGKDPYTRHYLEQRFGVSAVTKLPAGVTLADSAAKFVIID